MNSNTCKIAQLLFNYLYKWETIITRVNRSLNKRFKKSQKCCLLSEFFPERSCLLWDTARMGICGGFTVTYCSGISSAWDPSMRSAGRSAFQAGEMETHLALFSALQVACWNFLPLLNVFFSSHRRQIGVCLFYFQLKTLHSEKWKLLNISVSLIVSFVAIGTYSI